MAMSWQLKANRDRNKPMAKMNREQLEGVIAAADRIRAESDAIRARYDLPPVADSAPMREARERLALLIAKDAEKATKRRPSRAAKAPERVLTPAERADELAARKRAWKREGEALDREIAEFAASGDLGATALGRTLGVSRQRVYQLAAAA